MKNSDIIDLQIRNLEDLDYKNLLTWWKFWRFNPPPKDILPNNGLDGLMISKDGIDICAGFIYATSSPRLFWIEWIVSNPNVKDRKLRKTAIIILIQAINQMAKNMGGTTIYTTLKNQSLLNHYKECGYLVSGGNNIEMIKNLYEPSKP